MCGIVGIYNFNNNAPEILPEILIKMRDAMIHRGPDEGRTWLSQDKKVGLAFRRLAILDLSQNAMQPMSNEDQTIWVIFNGEIYNFAEVRSELERKNNHIWSTDHSDTEVIVHAYEEWGIECLSHFRGMFSIGIWDERKRKLWLARDRVGVKPLYYSIHDGYIVFASEIKALLENPGQLREVDEEAFFHYLSFLTTPAPQTLFKGIKKLPAGCWLRIDSNGYVEEKKYWDVWDHTINIANHSEEEIAELLLNELRISVNLRKISDVPIGVFLSGGIDSSINAILFSEGENRPINTFTIGYGGALSAYENEFTYARYVADIIGANHHEVTLTQDDLINFIPKMVQLQDEPIADPVCVPVYFLSKLARNNGVIVCQVGEGSDELFWGYPWWKRILQIERIEKWKFGRQISQLGAGILEAGGKGYSFYADFFRRLSAGQPAFWGGAEAFSGFEKQRLLSQRMHHKFSGYSSWEVIAPIRNRFLEKAWEPSPLHWMSYLDLNLRLPELLLMRVDKMSMGVSLEGRVPFLDHKLVELALSIPEHILTKHSVLKYILKKSVRGLLPNRIINRPKQGFGVPIYDWFLDRLGTQAKQILTTFSKNTDYLNKAEIDVLFEHRRAQQIWYLLNFAMWWNEYINR